MRMKIEELLEKYPSWNINKHDIVKVMYGDEPLNKWDNKRYEDYLKSTGITSNIQGTEAFIYKHYGDYYIYKTLIGEIYISANGEILSGNINVHYKGCNSICLNKMYGYNALDILKISSHNVVGFSNKGGIGSPTSKNKTKEMSKELIEKIIHNQMKDYGVSVQKFMASVREQYYLDENNYITKKYFSF